MIKIASSVAVLAVVLTAAVPGRARAQHFDPLQAAAIAEGVAGMIFGPLYPTPQCGPHDTPPPQPYRYHPSYSQPRPYAQPQPYQQRRLSDDDDDDGDYQVLQPRPVHHADMASDQPQNRPGLNDGSTQPSESGQSEYSPADNAADSGQDADPAPPLRPRRHHQSQDTASAQSGQVAEIPSQPSVPRSYQPPPEQ
jgi:hypothetical protein